MGTGKLALVVIAGAMMAATTVQAGSPVSPLDEATTQHELAVETQIQVTTPLRSATPAQLLAAIVLGADYLKEMAADVTDDNANNGINGVNETPDDPDDGGWDWVVTTPPAPVHHTTAASPVNIYGATALGLYQAYLVTGDGTYLTAMIDAANAMIANPSVRSAQDIVFLQLYNDLPAVSGTAYADSAKAKYDGRITTYGSAQALAEYIRDVRYGQGYGNGIIAWDIGSYVLAAAMLDARYGGYASDADDMAEVLWQDSFNDNPGYFDIVDDAGWDPTYTDKNFWWYNLGISGLITAFVASDTHTGELPGLAQLILDSQYASGAISGSYGANTNDEDWQSTAYCAMALARYDHTAYATEIGDMGGWIVATQDVGTTGGWRYSDDTHYPEVCGENVRGLYVAYLAASSVAAVDPGTCISIVDDCVTVDVDIARTDTAPMRGFSVDVTLTGVVPCAGLASFHEGTYLSSLGGAATTFQVVDKGGGVYTVDCAILGSPCGQTTAAGTLFEIDLESAGSDGVGTVAISRLIVRDCNNVNLPGIPGADLDLTIDTVPPVAVGDLTATQKKTGNDSDGTTVIQLAYTMPATADSAMVFRKGFGDYPEYDDGTGAVPTPPTDPADALANGWTFVPNAVLPNDEPAARDYYYYVMFTDDACDNVSTVSNMTGGTLNYHLGDVHDGNPPGGNGDNIVDLSDVSHLGYNYGITLTGYGDARNYLDVGPTLDYYVNTRPTTDDQVDFEDLMMFAINYGHVSKALPQLARDEGIVEDPTLVLRLDGTGQAGQLTARLLLEDNGTLVKGVHSVLSFDRRALRLLEARQGELLDGQSAPVFFKSLDVAGGAMVDAAIFGEGRTLEGSGEVAVLTFEVVGEGAFPTLTEAVLRDRNNRPAARRPIETVRAATDPTAVSAGLPSRLELVGARPNPFDASTQIVFRLPQASHVDLRVYDVNGRLVRTLASGTMHAGEITATWDGRAADGTVTSAGIYFYTFQAGEVRETRKLLRLR